MTLDEIPLDTRRIPQAALDIANRVRTNAFPWRGQFSPQLVELLLTHYAPQGGVILDPFAGVGTTLFESARQGLASCGTEINPAAVAMGESVMFVGMPVEARRRLLKEVRRVLLDTLPERPSLFSSGRDGASPRDCLAQLAAEHRDEPYQRNVFVNALINLLEADQPADSTAALRAFDRHASTIIDLPFSPAICRMEHRDARDLPLGPGAVDLVITSPPYINVFNYHQNNRVAMERLGWDLLAVAKAEFGSNRKNRGNRFLTVVSYCVNMHATFQELRRVTKPGGRVIIVIGRESKVRGVSFQNGMIVAQLARLAGFTLLCRQERKYLNRFGATIFEDILHLLPSDSENTPDATPVATAKVLLRASLSTDLEQEVLADLQAAIDGAEAVGPSPVFDLRTAWKGVPRCQ